MTLLGHEVMDQLPGTWHGLFNSLSSSSRPLESAEAWYQDATGSQYGHKPVWTDLLRSLVIREPVQVEGTRENQGIAFKPRLLLLKPEVQRNFTNFLLRNLSSIPTADIKGFLQKLHTAVDSDGWQFEHLRLLQQLSQTACAAEVSSPFPALYQMTAGNKPQAEALYAKLKNRKTLSCNFTDPWQRKFQFPVSPDSHKTAQLENSSTIEVSYSFVRDETPVMPKIASQTPPEIIDLEDSFEQEPSPKRPRLDAEDNVAMETREQEVEMDRDTEVASIQLSQSREETLDQLKEVWQNATEICPCRDDLEALFRFNSEEMSVVCSNLGLTSMSETSIATACKHIATIGDIISYSNCVIFLSFGLLEKVKNMSQNASRVLASTMTLIAERFPKQLIDSVLIPCLLEDLRAPQAELLGRVVKESLNNTGRSYLLQKFVEEGVLVTESSLQILQITVDRKSEVSDTTASRLVTAFHSSASSFENNLKYGKLLVAIVNTYGRQFSSDSILLLNSITDTHKTFWRKALQNAIKKLTKK